LGIVDPSWKPTERPDAIAAWDSLDAEQKDRFDHVMAVYAATVSRMDKAIGDLTKGLKERGELDNTLILFMSDNGGNAEAGPEGRSNGDPTKAASNWFCGESWAFLQNTPFRLYKHYNHEGGIATPLIAHWPSGITGKNELRTQPAHLIDIVATCVDVAKTAPLTHLNGIPLTPLEGRSLVPAFVNKPIQRDGLFWEHEGNAAVRDGDWKLVRKGSNGQWELYDLASDRTEQRNLAQEQPAQAKKLATMWEDWAARAQVKPTPDVSKQKKKEKAAQQ
jgi:arylsulfatase